MIRSFMPMVHPRLVDGFCFWFSVPFLLISGMLPLFLRAFCFTLYVWFPQKVTLSQWTSFLDATDETRVHAEGERKGKRGGWRKRGRFKEDVIDAAKEIESCRRTWGTNRKGKDGHRKAGSQGRSGGIKDAGAIIKGRTASFQVSKVKQRPLFSGVRFPHPAVPNKSFYAEGRKVGETWTASKSWGDVATPKVLTSLPSQWPDPLSLHHLITLPWETPLNQPDSLYPGCRRTTTQLKVPSSN